MRVTKKQVIVVGIIAFGILRFHGQKKAANDDEQLTSRMVQQSHG